MSPYDLEPITDDRDRRLCEARRVMLPGLVQRLRLEEMAVEELTPSQAKARYDGPKFPFLFGRTG